jgi:hypothetical protein
MREHGGSTPNASWYVVNHTREKSPATRKLAMSDNAEDVADFKDGYNGLVVDTTALFRLCVDVAEGAISNDGARKLLTTASGLFIYPAKNTRQISKKVSEPDQTSDSEKELVKE